MRVPFLALLLLSVGLSGCMADDAEPVDEPTDPATGPQVDRGNQTVSKNPYWPSRSVEPRAIHWNGTLGTFAFACEYQTTGACPGHTVEANQNSIYIDGPFLLDAVDITLSWNAGNLFLEELHFEIMTMGDDAGDEELKSIVGSSPLNIKLEDLGLNLTENDRIHIFAYNPKGLIHHPPLVAHASLWQDINVSGSLTRTEAAVETGTQ